MLWVPGRLLLEASKSAELAHFLTNSVLRGGLLPARLPPAAVARQWGAIYMAAEPQARAHTHPSTPARWQHRDRHPHKGYGTRVSWQEDARSVRLQGMESLCDWHASHAEDC